MPLSKLPTAALLTLVCCTSLFFQTTAAVATNFNLRPRKTVDHNIVCDETLPTARTWPADGPPRSSFGTLGQIPLLLRAVLSLRLGLVNKMGRR